MPKVTKKIDWIFQTVTITSDSEEYNTLSEDEKILTLKQEMWIDDDKTLAEIETEKNKQKEIQDINTEFDNLVKSYDSEYPEEEIKTFPIQEREASYIDGKSNPSIKESDFIRKLAENRWEDFKELAKKIKEKSEDRNTFIAQKLAEKQIKIKALDT